MLKQGYSLITRNFLVRRGEIDLIMKDTNDELVFVEVKTRKNNAFGSAAESITSSKAQKLIATAYTYLQRNHLPDDNFRIDLVTVTYPGPIIEHLKHAITE